MNGALNSITCYRTTEQAIRIEYIYTTEQAIRKRVYLIGVGNIALFYYKCVGALNSNSMVKFLIYRRCLLPYMIFLKKAVRSESF